MKEVNIAKARDSFSEIIAKVSYSGEKFIIKRRGKPVAAIVTVKDLSKIQQADQAREKGTLLSAAGAWKNYSPPSTR